MRYAAIDIGSSFIKHALLYPETAELRDISKTATPVCAPSVGGQSELDLKAFARLIRGLIDSDIDSGGLDGVMFSSQMSGLYLKKADGEPLIPFITWQDTRGMHPGPDGRTPLQRIREDLPAGALQTSGEVFCGSQSLCILRAFNETDVRGARLLQLGDALAEELTGHPVPMHITMAAATGMYNVALDCWDADLTAGWGLLLPEVTWDVKSAGEYRGVPLYLAVGDHQCSVLGGLLCPGDLLVNVATGAQLARIMPEPVFGNFSARPYFEKQYLQAVTHLPGGRMLNVLIGFLTDAGRLLSGESPKSGDVWAKLTDEIEKTDSRGLHMQLSAQQLAAGTGGISGIGESNLRFGSLFRAAYEEMADAFYGAWLRMGSPEFTRLVFAGSVSRKSALFRKLLAERFNKPCVLTPFDEDDMIGLLRLSMAASGLCTLQETHARLLGVASD